MEQYILEPILDYRLYSLEAYAVLLAGPVHGAVPRVRELQCCHAVGELVTNRLPPEERSTVKGSQTDDM